MSYSISEYTINGRTYRNLEAQVLKNACDIKELQEADPEAEGVVYFTEDNTFAEVKEAYEAGKGLYFNYFDDDLSTTVILPLSGVNEPGKDQFMFGFLAQDTMYTAGISSSSEYWQLHKTPFVSYTQTTEENMVYSTGVLNEALDMVEENFDAIHDAITEIEEELDEKSVVSGTNDGTNWLTLTVNGVTRQIPSGGSGDSSITYFNCSDGDTGDQWKLSGSFTLADIVSAAEGGKTIVLRKDMPTALEVDRVEVALSTLRVHMQGDVERVVLESLPFTDPSSGEKKYIKVNEQVATSNTLPLAEFGGGGGGSNLQVIATNLNNIGPQSEAARTLWNLIKADIAEHKVPMIRDMGADQFLLGGDYYVLSSTRYSGASASDIADATFTCTMPAQGQYVQVFYIDKYLDISKYSKLVVPAPNYGPDNGKVLTCTNEGIQWRTPS